MTLLALALLTFACGDDTTDDSATTTETDTFVGGGSYAQDFEDTSLFVDGATGTQVFTDGARFVDEPGTSKLGFGSAHAGAQALNFYNEDGTTPASVRLEMPVAALSTETVAVSLWAYNPFTRSVDVELRRDDGASATLAVPAQDWTELTHDLSAEGNTRTVQLLVGAVTQQNSFSFRIDDVVIETR